MIVIVIVIIIGIYPPNKLGREIELAEVRLLRFFLELCLLLFCFKRLAPFVSQVVCQCLFKRVRSRHKRSSGLKR